MATYDFAIIGGGIVGLATAYRLGERFPDSSVLVLEKEPQVGDHQTGHNSGVLHSGIYYKPGSLKAQNCRDGKLAMQAFCEQEEIPFDLCGKVIVAVNESELPALERIFDRGRANGVRCEMVDEGQLRDLEPHAAGIQGIHVPETGIVSFRRVAQRLAERIEARGHVVQTAAQVTGIRREAGSVVLQTPAGSWTAARVINCAGLHCDRVARMAGAKPTTRIVPFRGEYYELRPEAEHLCRTLIYPVPDPSFPFLGVHFTRMIEGGVECGPNAVFAMAREGYRKTDVSLRDLYESLGYGGFWKLAWKYWRTGAGEMYRSFSKRAFVRALQRLVPEVRSPHLVSARAGVRAQAIAADGSMVDDFVIEQDDQFVHVLNAPSPAATSALNIGSLIVQRLVSPSIPG